MDFVKAHGTGNDFVVLPDWDDELDLPDQLVRGLCDRRSGLGADGVLRIVAADGDADVWMDHRNADASRPEMCGNGVRVVAKHVVDHGLVVPDGDTVRVRTRAGVKRVRIHRDAAGRVTSATVGMGPPILDPASIPFEAPGSEAVGVTIDAAGRQVELTAVSMGNPHAVVLVDDVERCPVAELGVAIGRHERFPRGANVEFVELTGGGRAAVRVWERGVGETAACGTGACAVLVAGQQLGRFEDQARLRFPGGEVVVRHVPSEDGGVTLTGDAVEVASGELDPGWLAAIGAAETEPGQADEEATPR